MDRQRPYIVPGKCHNPECKVRTIHVWCCEPCRWAHVRHYEIHEDGLLGHAPDCEYWKTDNR